MESKRFFFRGSLDLVFIQWCSLSSHHIWSGPFIWNNFPPSTQKTAASEFFEWLRLFFQEIYDFELTMPVRYWGVIPWGRCEPESRVVDHGEHRIKKFLETYDTGKNSASFELFILDLLLTRMHKGFTLNDDGHFCSFTIKLNIWRLNNLKLDKFSTWICHSGAVDPVDCCFIFFVSVSHELGGNIPETWCKFFTERLEILDRIHDCIVGCPEKTLQTIKDFMVHLAGTIDGKRPALLLYIWTPYESWDIFHLN